MIGSQYLVFPNTFSPVLTDGMSVRFSHDSGPAQFPVCPLFGNNESRLRGFEPQHLDSWFQEAAGPCFQRLAMSARGRGTQRGHPRIAVVSILKSTE